MKALKTILNVFGIIFAVILSIALLATLIVAPVISAGTNFITPKSIQDVITSIDYEEIITETAPEISETIENVGLPTEMLTEVLDSDATEDLIEIYVGGIKAVVAGDENYEGLTAESIINIANENIDELADIAIKHLPDDKLAAMGSTEVVKEQISNVIISEVEKGADKIATALPDVKEMVEQNADKETLETIRYILNGTVSIVLWVTVVILSLLVFGCRWPRFKGFMWLGVVYFLATITSFTIGGLVKGALFTAFVAENFIASQILSPALSVIVGHINLIGFIFLGITALLIAAFVVGRVYLSKRKVEVIEGEVPADSIFEEQLPENVTETEN